MTVRVLIVDDEELVRAGFRIVLESESESVPMDIRIPSLEGLVATRWLLDSSTAGAECPRILLLTTFDLDAYVDEARRARAALLSPSAIQPERPAKLVKLTARELEVLGALARGLSNAEIAQDLVVGETTVKTHVARILMKLGLRDRVQAVVFAYETGLVRPGSSG